MSRMNTSTASMIDINRNRWEVLHGSRCRMVFSLMSSFDKSCPSRIVYLFVDIVKSEVLDVLKQSSR
jgi:hypothetical protein